MYYTYYINLDRVHEKWFCRRDGSDVVLGKFEDKESAIQYANSLCSDAVNCSIVVNDGRTYTVKLDRLQCER